MANLFFLGPDQPGSYSGSPYFFASAVKKALQERALGELELVRLPRTREVLPRALAWGLIKQSDPRVYNISIEFLDHVMAPVPIPPRSTWIFPLQALPTRFLHPNASGARIALFLDCTLPYLIKGYGLESRLSSPVRRSLLEREHASYERADMIFCYHEDIRTEISLTHGISKDKIRVIGRGVNIEGLEQCGNERSSSSEKFKLIFVGADARRKGLFDLIAAIDALPSASQAKVELVVIGPPAGQVPKRPYVKAMGFLDYTQRDTVIRLMREADLGVLLSSAEGLPGFVWEMLYLGKPILTTKLPQYSAFTKEFPVAYVSNPVVIDEVSETLRKILDGNLTFPIASADLRRSLSWEKAGRKVAEWVAEVSDTK